MPNHARTLSRIAAVLGASLAFTTFAYLLAAGCYYLFLAGIAEYYGGHVKTAQAIATLTRIGCWFVAIGTPVTFSIGLFVQWQWITSKQPLLKDPRPQSAPASASTRFPKPILCTLSGKNIHYPLWSPFYASCNILAGIAALTFFATFHQPMLGPDFFSHEAAATINTPWLRAIYLWADGWWSPVHVWLMVSLASLSLIKGSADYLIHLTSPGA